MTLRWHITTPELPPLCGGVGDYTAQIAEALARNGDTVTVYAPPAGEKWKAPAGVELVTLPDRFGSRSMGEMSSRLDRGESARLLVQYVPAVMGRRGANLPFCTWLQTRRDAGADVRLMFHEPYLYFRWRPDHFVIAAAQRMMARRLLAGASRVYLSTDTWRRYLAPYGEDAIRRAVTLPIPSAIPRVHDESAVQAARDAAIGAATALVGHFGSYGGHIAPLVRQAVSELLASDAGVAVLCMGAGSEPFVARIVAERPDWRGRLTATGRIPSRDASTHLQACDVLIQPYPDGVTTRRTSVMAGLVNGRAVVTSDGPLTENVWRETGCVRLAASPPAVAAGALALLSDAASRTSLEARALATYGSRFDVRHTIAVLRAPVPAYV